jgi:hypothetical protein
LNLGATSRSGEPRRAIVERIAHLLKKLLFPCKTSEFSKTGTVDDGAAAIGFVPPARPL